MNIFIKIKNFLFGRNKRKKPPFEIISMGKNCKCMKCANIYPDGRSCVSYPGRIPKEILSGEVQHDKARGDERYFKFQDKEFIPIVFYNENYVTDKTIFDFNPTKEELEKLCISISKRKYIKQTSESKIIYDLKKLFKYRGDEEMYEKYYWIYKTRNPFYMTGYTDVVVSNK